MYQFCSILFILYRIENFLVRDLSHAVLLGVRELSHAARINSRNDISRNIARRE